MKSMAVQLKEMFDVKTIVRRLRKITNAQVGHGYNAELYAEYDDGSIQFVKNVQLKMNETNVRLRISREAVWEENIRAAPGWFRCEDPLK